MKFLFSDITQTRRHFARHRQARRGLGVAAWAVAALLGGTTARVSFAQQSTTGGAEASLPDAPEPQQQPAAGVVAAGHGSISGIVSDVNGGIVRGAYVTLTLHNHDVATTTSAEDGRFHFTALEPGTYNVVIAATGLETFLSAAVVLKANERFELPDVALPIASATQTVNVVMTQEEVADEELKAETQQRVFGVFPNYYTSFLWNAAPLTAKQKFRLSFKTVTDPVALAGTAVTAGIETGRDTFPDWGQDAASYGKRFAAAYGDQLFGRMLGSALYPTIFRQDPRYFYMGPGSSTGKRLKHALLAGVEARGDNGKWQPNYSHVLGNASAGALSTVYHPASNSAGSLALDNALIGIIGGSVQGVVREFVTSRITHKVPAYAKGKPAAAPAPVESAPASQADPSPSKL